MDFINSNKSDIIVVTETWLRSGVGFFIRNDIDFKVVPQPCFNNFESISVHLAMGNAQDIILHTMNRPLNVSKDKFIEDCSSFVEGAAL